MKTSPGAQARILGVGIGAIIFFVGAKKGDFCDHASSTHSSRSGDLGTLVPRSYLTLFAIVCGRGTTL